MYFLMTVVNRSEAPLAEVCRGFCKRDTELQQHNFPRLDYSITLHLGDVLRKRMKCLFSILQIGCPEGSTLVYSMTQCIRCMLPLPADLAIGGLWSQKANY